MLYNYLPYFLFEYKSHTIHNDKGNNLHFLSRYVRHNIEEDRIESLVMEENRIES